jgi:hypothetical protein
MATALQVQARLHIFPKTTVRTRRTALGLWRYSEERLKGQPRENVRKLLSDFPDSVWKNFDFPPLSQGSMDVCTGLHSFFQ